MMSTQKWASLAQHKAKYPLLSVIGLFIFMQLLTHDGQIYNAVETGYSDANTLHQLYFPQWTNEQGTDMARATLGGIIVLVIYAIVIKVAQRKAGE